MTGTATDDGGDGASATAFQTSRKRHGDGGDDGLNTDSRNGIHANGAGSDADDGNNEYGGSDN
jgi:hypothetical protein